MTPAQLIAITNTSASTAEAWAPVLEATCALYGIDTPLRVAAFVGQCAEESAAFTELVENLNYAAEALVRVWPDHFTEALAQQYGRVDGVHEANQPMIANIAYANRMGNGDVASEDGWNFRGRGIIDNTGRAQYAALSRELNVDLIAHPELLEEPTYAARAAGAYWRDHNLNRFADVQDYRSLTEAINGGTIGLADRVALIERALTILKT